jgi:type II secretory pathway pseudopilin PulG
MNEPERPINTSHAFCSLFLPGLGQWLQGRVGAAAGFFVLFILSGFLPLLIVSLLFMDRFSQQPLPMHLLHISLFALLFFLFMAAILWSALDAARKPKETQGGRFPFTFGGLLVAIALMGVLIVLLLPSIPSAREAARRTQCANNMKQIAAAFHMYHNKHGHFPPAYTVDEEGKPLHSWRVLILPYIKQNALYEQIRLDEPWDSEYNRQFHSEAPLIYQCRSIPQDIPFKGGTSYSVIDGEEAAFFGSQVRVMSDEKMLRETIFLVERIVPVNWMDPSREITFETACRGINVDAMGISSYHSGGVYGAMGDGRVQFINSTVDSERLRRLLLWKEQPLCAEEIEE